MRLPRPQFTIRRLMLAVAASAVLLGVGDGVVRIARRVAFSRRMVTRSEQALLRLSIQERYASRAIEGHEGRLTASRRVPDAKPELIAPIARDVEAARARSAGLRRRIDYWASLLVKYDRAAQRPWVPVEPDPPEPD